MLGQPGAKVSAAGLKLVGACLGLPVDGVFAPTVTARSHREGIPPARHVGLELSHRASQVGLQSVPHRIH